MMNATTKTNTPFASLLFSLFASALIMGCNGMPNEPVELKSKGEDLETEEPYQESPAEAASMATDSFAVNFAGPTTKVGTVIYKAQSLSGVTVTGATTWSTNKTLNLNPAADSSTRTLLRSAIYRSNAADGQGFRISRSLSNGTYDITLYCHENYRSNFRNMDIVAEGFKIASAICDLPLRSWQILGPYRVTVLDGTLDVDALRGTKGDPSLFAMNVQLVALQPTPTPAPVATPTPVAQDPSLKTVNLSTTTTLDINTPSAINGFRSVPVGDGIAWGYMQGVGSYLEWRFNVAQAGLYGINLNYATVALSGADLYVNSVNKAYVPFDITSGWYESYLDKSTNVILPVGVVALRIVSTSFNPFNIANITIGPIGVAALPTPTPQPAATPSPTPSPAATPVPQIAGVVYAPVFAQPTSANEVVSFNLQNNGTVSIPARYITFGQTFVKGQVPPTSRMSALIAGVTQQVQMDVKATHEDGSVRMAALTMLQPQIAANSSLGMMLLKNGSALGSAIDLSTLSGYSFLVTLNMTSGATGTFNIDVAQSLRNAIANSTANFWLAGPMASQARVSIPVTKSLRIVADVTKYADGSMVTDLQVNNDIAMSLSGGRLDYSATINYNGAITSFSALEHHQYSQWRRVFYSNGKPQVNVQHDPAYLIQSKAVLPYDLTNGVNGSKINGYATFLQSSDSEAPFATNGILTYMPNTGGRPDIGPTTEPNRIWITTQNETARDMALAQGQAAAGIPWHFWDASKDRWMSTLDYPRMWVDARGGVGTPGDPNSGGLTQQISHPIWTPDTAHMPELSYVPYIMTGTRFHLDQLNAQGLWGLVAFWDYPRRNYDNQLSGKSWNNLVVVGNQIRGSAWALRQFQLASYIGLDGSYEKNYYTEMMATNLDFMNAQAPILQAQATETYGFLPGEYGVAGAIPAWQQDYLMSALAMAARQGQLSALTYINWSKNFYVGRFQTRSGWNPKDGVAYLIAISDPSGGPFYTTWSKIGSEMVTRGWSNGAGWDSTRDGEYGQLGLMSLSLIYDLTQDQAAKSAYYMLLDAGVPWCSLNDFRNDTKWFMKIPPR